MNLFWIVLLIVVFIPHYYTANVHAHESCCAAKQRRLEEQLKLQQQQQQQQYDLMIPDPMEQPPDEYQGQPRLIPDPNNNVQPDDWDEEDDGIWKPPMIQNPRYSWKPQLIPNPHLPPEFIPDSTEEPPDVFEGQPRYIPDPNNNIQPDDWDEEDDGIWKPPLVENPHYNWKPQLIPNPSYPRKSKSKLTMAQFYLFLEELHHEINMTMPWVLLGILVISVMNLWSFPMSLETIKGLLSTSTTTTSSSSLLIPSLIKASALGLLTPLCSCGAIPIASGFITNAGISLSSTITFLTASQSAGIDSALITWGLLGPMATLCRLLGAMILSISVGMAVVVPNNNNTKEEKKTTATKNGTTTTTTTNGTTTANGADSTTNDKDTMTNNGGKRSNHSTTTTTTTTTKDLLTNVMETSVDILPMLLFGLTISTAAVYYLPILVSMWKQQNWNVAGSSGILLSLIPSGGSNADAAAATTIVQQIMVRMALFLAALPLQLCEHTTVTIAAAIQKAGGSPGLAFAFLLTAPATNLPSLLLLLQKAKTNNNSGNSSSSMTTVIRMIVAFLTTSLLLSYSVDLFQLDMLVEKEAQASNGMMITLPEWYIGSSPWIAATIFVMGLLKKLSGKTRIGASLQENNKMKSNDDNCGSGCCSTSHDDNDTHMKQE